MIQETSDSRTLYFYRGRVALFALLRALGIGPKDEVILQAFTCLAVPAPILALGARPVYVDIKSDTYNLDPTLLEQRITPRTKAIVVQHTYGNPADISRICAIAKTHHLPVIEDCCHVSGSRYLNRELGSFGVAAFYSYEWGKPVVVGLGGAAVVQSADLYRKLAEQYREFVRPSSGDVLLVQLEYLAHTLLRRPSLFWTLRDVYRALSKMNLIVGSFRPEEFDGKPGADYQWRMPRQLKMRLDRKQKQAPNDIEARRLVMLRYESVLRELGLPCIGRDDVSDPVLLRYPLLTRDKARVLSKARADRVELGGWFSSVVDPLARDEWNKVGYSIGSCPVAEFVSGRVVTLPVYGNGQERAIETNMRFLNDMCNDGLLELAARDKGPSSRAVPSHVPVAPLCAAMHNLEQLTGDD